jgi:hemoglobin
LSEKLVTLRGLLVSLIMLTILLGCTSRAVNDSELAVVDADSLYNELGGRQRLVVTVDNLIRRLHQDSRLSELFVEVNDIELKQNLVDFLCQVADGGCEYQGAEMLDIHSELFITKGEFDHFVTLFIYSMQDAKISFVAQNKLLARLAAMRSEVIEL